MSANLSPNLDLNYSSTTAVEHFSVALIGPDAEKREAVAGALARWPGADIRQFPSYPPNVDDVAELLKLSFDIVVIDAESDTEYAAQIVENMSTRGSAAVMAYAWSARQEMQERFKRAGAREYLEAPFEFSVPSALERAADARYAKTNPARSWEAKLLVFFGAKGGAGTTTVACSYAMALAQESRQRTLLIDLGLPLGDAALNLGLTCDYSTEDALKNPEQMDPSLLEALVAKHASGIEVLAAPSRVPEVSPSSEAIDTLMKVARKVYTNVIVDVGSRVDLMNTTLFAEAYRIYLVSQAGISDLRNAERLMSRYFDGDSQRLEIVINRFEPGAARVSEDQMTSALGRPVRWKIPAEHDALHAIQNAQEPVSEMDSPFTRAVLEMAGSITLHPVRASKSNAAANISSTSTWQKISESTSKSIGTGQTSNAGGAVENTINPSGLPEVSWQSPEPITFGTALNDTQLNATAAVPGSFVYTPGPGYVLPVGTHTLWVTFTPDSGAMVQSAVSITVSKATPTITWPVPRPITCDTPLSELQLNATASVPGRFEYAPEIGKVLNAGEHALAVVFTPADDKSYTATKATVSITVEKLRPQIDWPLPEKIRCGSKLGPKQLNAKASVAGTFVYTPEAGEVLEPGQHLLTVHFTPADGSRYTMAQSNITVTVMKAPPRITWQTPEPIVYGTPLSTGQLNAAASEEGSFAYSPGMGSILAVGEHTPLVTFTPHNNPDYPSIQAAVPLTVVMAKPSISWNPLDTLSAGTPLSDAQLNATATVPGSFRYKPSLGEILPVGKHTLNVTFTPTDSMNYEPVKATVPITVTELERVQVNWPTPAAIPYGTPLSEVQLNAKASVPGSFAYGPCEGVVLPPGKHTLVAVFTPEDTATCAVANATVTLKVDALPDIASLLSVHTQGPIGREVADQQIPEINAPEIPVKKSSSPAVRQTVAAERAPAKEQVLVVERVAVQEPPPVPVKAPAHIEKPRETRTYKGVVYEKGDDGQWHRLQK
jgi:Flp pilus assembly CpaE family ATPase